jgi:hypothetical protein
MKRRRDRRRSRFARSATIVAVTAVATLAIVLFITVHAFTAKPGDWSIPIRYGLLGMGPTMRSMAPA